MADFFGFFFFSSLYFNVYRQSLASCYILVGQQTGCNHVFLLLLYECMTVPWVTPFKTPLTFPFQTHLQISKGRRHSCGFLPAYQAFVSPSFKQHYSIPLSNPRSFLQWYTTVLDVCAVMIHVGKTLSMIWSSFVCLRKRSHIAFNLL